MGSCDNNEEKSKKESIATEENILDELIFVANTNDTIEIFNNLLLKFDTLQRIEYITSVYGNKENGFNLEFFSNGRVKAFESIINNNHNGLRMLFYQNRNELGTTKSTYSTYFQGMRLKEGKLEAVYLDGGKITDSPSITVYFNENIGLKQIIYKVAPWTKNIKTKVYLTEEGFLDRIVGYSPSSFDSKVLGYYKIVGDSVLFKSAN